MKKIICIGMLAASVALLSGCSKDEYRKVPDSHFKEWISPDGVHYWYACYGYSGYLAPRYDRSGNLVID